MARIEMSRDFDWTVPGTKSRTVIALKAGESYTVKRECADAAIAAGAGKEVGAPSAVREEDVAERSKAAAKK